MLWFIFVLEEVRLFPISSHRKQMGTERIEWRKKSWMIPLFSESHKEAQCIETTLFISIWGETSIIHLENWLQKRASDSSFTAVCFEYFTKLFPLVTRDALYSLASQCSQSFPHQELYKKKSTDVSAFQTTSILFVLCWQGKNKIKLASSELELVRLWVAST